MNTTTAIFVSTSYDALASGSLLIPSDTIKTDTLTECEVFVAYIANTEEVTGAAYALNNIVLRRKGEAIEVLFDPNTDVTAIPFNLIHAYQHKPNHAKYEIVGAKAHELAAVPRFNVSSHARASDKQLIALNHDVRQRMLQFKAGLISLTEFVLALYEHNIYVSDIHQDVNVGPDDLVAVLTRRPTHAIELNRDNGVTDESNFPVLARLTVLL